MIGGLFAGADPGLPGILADEDPTGPLPVRPPVLQPVAASPAAGPVPTDHASRFERIRTALGRGVGTLFGGLDDPRLSAEQNARARGMAVARAGLATLAGGGDPGIGGTLSALAGGALAGQQAGGQARDALVQRGLAGAHQQRLAAILAGAQNGEIGLPELHQMFGEAVRVGDADSARSISEVIKAVEAAQRPSGTPLMKVTGPNGTTQLRNPYTGELVQEIEGTPELEARDLGDRVVYFPKGHPERIVHIARKGRLPGTGSDGIEQQRAFQREGSLADDYRAETKDIVSAYRFIDSALQNTATAKAGDPTSQVQMLYAFVKAMDPTSVVREGEIHLANSALPVWTRAQAMIQEYTENKAVAVPPAMVDQMAALMRKMQAEKEQAWGDIRDTYSDRAKRFGVDPEIFRGPPNKYRPTAKRGDALDKYLP